MKNVREIFSQSVIWGILLCFVSSLGFAFEHPGGIHTQSQIDFTRQKIITGKEPWASAWDDLLLQANNRLSETPSALKHFFVPGYYENKAAHIANKKPLKYDTYAAYTCALVYAMNIGSSRDRYADKVVQLLNNWAAVNKTYAGDGVELTMIYISIGMIYSAELIWDYPGWNNADKILFKKWAGTVLRKASDRKKNWGLPRIVKQWGGTPYHSNHNMWGILMAVSLDHLLDDQEGLNKDIELLKYLIDISIEKDGRLPAEHRRKAKSISYTAFALEPLTAAIEVVRNSGGPELFDWQSPNGSTVKSALTYLFDKGLENPSKWPVSGAAGHKENIHRSVEIFAAMGRVYGVDKWINWVHQPKIELDTGVGIIAPLLMQMRTNKKQKKPRKPTGLTLNWK